MSQQKRKRIDPVESRLHAILNGVEVYTRDPELIELLRVLKENAEDLAKQVSKFKDHADYGRCLHAMDLCEQVVATVEQGIKMKYIQRMNSHKVKSMCGITIHCI